MIDVLFKGFGVLGILLVTAGVLHKKKQDWFFLPGGIFLLVYSISIKDVIFIVLQCIYILAVLWDMRKSSRKFVQR